MNSITNDDIHVRIFVNAESAQAPFRPLVSWSWAARLSTSSWFWRVSLVLLGLYAAFAALAGVAETAATDFLDKWQQSAAYNDAKTAAGIISATIAALVGVVLLTFFDRTVLRQLLATPQWWYVLRVLPSA